MRKTHGAPRGTTDKEEEEGLNILFLGNSLMYYNDMPKLFAETAKANGKEVRVESVTKGSATVSDFADESTEVGARAIPLLKNNAWDIVVIEPSRRISPYEGSVKAAELSAARRLRELADASGGELLLYSVWGNDNGKVIEYRAITPTEMIKVAAHEMSRGAHTAFMHDVNAELAAALGGVKTAEAGYAFENCIARYAYELYDADRRHPSPIGSYLAAAVIYATIYGEAVRVLPWAIENAPARGELEGIANETVFEGLVPASL